MDREKTEKACKKAMNMLMAAWKICKIAFILFALFGIISAVVIYSRGGYGDVKLQSTWRDVVFVFGVFFAIVIFDKAVKAANKAMWNVIRPCVPDKSAISRTIKFFSNKAGRNKKDSG